MLAEELNSKESRELLSAVDRMREILQGNQICLPEIVVVGDQSVELRMKVTTGDEYAIIHNSQTPVDAMKTIYDMEDIADEVIRLTNDIAGNGTNVVLHVIPSSVDFSTSESTKLAKEFDPDCERQLIAVSKIDKYDKGIAKKLVGEGPGSMKLQLGCVAVLNRNQDEIDSNVSFEEMKERERQFFIKHREAFQNLSDEYKGVDQLVKKLATIQHSRIRSTLPETIEKLRNQIRNKRLELKNIPMAMTTEHECWSKFQSMIDAFRESIQAKVNGDYDCEIRSSMFNVNSNASGNTNNTTTEASSRTKVAFVSVSGDDHIAYHLYKFLQKFQEALRNSFSDFSTVDYPFPAGYSKTASKNFNFYIFFVF
ncbi:unnamed protein product [Rotaria sp. Silwood1]|nr:unnamed protein product [Rotaria sp. Silwood1]